MVLKKNKVFLLLGSNVEPREWYVSQSVALITQRLDAKPVESGLYESEPWGFQSETLFLNQVVSLDTALSVEEIFLQTQQIEIELGRKRLIGEGYSSRNIDIDILYVNDIILETEHLILPHPRMHLRRFTLLPLAELAPAWVHPVLDQTHTELLLLCHDQGKVWKYSPIKS